MAAPTATTSSGGIVDNISADGKESLTCCCIIGIFEHPPHNITCQMVNKNANSEK